MVSFATSAGVAPPIRNTVARFADASAESAAVRLDRELAPGCEGHGDKRIESQRPPPGPDGGPLLGYPLHPYAEIESEHDRPGGLKLDIRSRLRDLDETGSEVPRAGGPGVADLVDLA